MSHVLSSLREIDLNLLVRLKVLLSYRHVEPGGRGARPDAIGNEPKSGETAVASGR